MKISDIFKQNSVHTQYSSGTKEAKEKKEEQSASASQVASSALVGGEDQVQISDLGRQLAQLKRILNDDESSQQSRLQTLKDQIEKGTYDVSANDLARSIVAFAKDE